MADKKLFLGIDTSNYTTSSALADDGGNILLNFKKLLPVKEGERGLRQSDAVFHHVKGLPEAAREVERILADSENGGLTALGVSYAPRDTEGSYMPCFLSGLAAAEYVSAVTNIPLYRVSHQAGHIMAALNSACRNAGIDRSDLIKKTFVSFHVSGGTTDVLLCNPDFENVFNISNIGGTNDINAGQAIDRTGVMMGISFPCGAAMDKMAMEYDGKLPKPKISVNGANCNLSGLENKAAEMYKECEDPKKTSAYTLSFIASTLSEITKNVLAKYGDLPIVYAGGVMSSAYIKKSLSKYGIFADPEFSSDNAAGTALLAAELYKRGIVQDER